MKKQLLKILKIYSHEYEIMVFDLYTDWCARKTKNQIQLQKLLASPSLFNWWYKELRTFELKFLVDCQPFGKSLQKELANDFYHECVEDIHKIFSKPLIKQAYDRKSITAQN